MINDENAKYIFKCLAFKIKTYEELGKEFNMHKTTLCKQMKIFKPKFNLKDKEKFNAYTYLRFFHKDEIIYKYVQELQGTEKIIQTYGLKDGHIISKILQYYNIPIRSTGYISKTNQSLFKEIKDEITAYTLGLITADGNVNDSYEISICLKADDKYLLEEINQKLLNNTGSFSYDNRLNKETYKLRFFGKQICQNLQQYNVIPKKTYSLQQICNFDEPFMKHYIRGLYDGDGICTKNGKYLRIGFCGYNKEFVQSFQQYLVNFLAINNNQLFNTKSS